MFGIAPLLLVLPMAGFLFNAFAGRRFVEHDRQRGEKWSGWVASYMALGAFVVALILASSLSGVGYHAQTIMLFDWIKAGDFHVPWAMQIDTLSATMILVVTGVGSLIHIYAIGYMHGDKDFNRFFAYLNLFLFFMLILVTGNNYLMLFVGWEGVGLCSFLLIGFWFDKTENGNAARKAFVANRVGDLAMILAMGLTFWTFKSLEFETVFFKAEELFQAGHMVPFGATGIELSLGAVLTAITALFLMGAAGKSAQIPLYIWLPDAMAGPTPVSALIHAATMVTSGIYLIVRSNVLFEIVRASGTVLPVLGISSNDLVAYIGALTALFAGLIAFTQFDIKKVLAYSTVSQLGFMIAAVGMGAYVAGMFHLITHAFFKALLFLGSGSVIHGMEHGHHHLHHNGHHENDGFDPQDMRTMGNLKKHMPITSVVFHIGALALAGIPIFAGFWSKDEILAHASANSFGGIGIILTVAAFCTAFYMGRQLKMVFHGDERHEAARHAHESPPVMTYPLIVLAALSIVGGMYINLPYIPFIAEEQAEVAEVHVVEDSEEVTTADAHGEDVDSHSDITDEHATTDTHSEDSEAHAEGGNFLRLEHWLEHSIASFHLTEEGVVDMPHTPTTLSLSVAGASTIFAVIALAGSFFGLYGNKPQTAEEEDPLQVMTGPVWRFFAALPFNTLGMAVIVPAFNRFAYFCGIIIDWRFYHNYFHEVIIRDGFVGISKFVSNVLDKGVVDGLLVNGAAKLTGKLADLMRMTQTGYVRHYAFSVVLGVVALLAYFILNVN